MTPGISSFNGVLRLLYFFIGLIVATSCNTSLDKREYIHWVENYENGLHVRKASDPFVFDLQYLPGQYISLQRNFSQDSSLHDNLEHFVLTISTPDSGEDFIDHGIRDFAEKQRRLYYFSYLFQNDIHLEQHGEIIPCVLFHFEQQTNTKTGKAFVLAFEKSNKKSDELMFVIDSQQLGSLPVRIKISKSNIPVLKT